MAGRVTNRVSVMTASIALLMLATACSPQIDDAKIVVKEQLVDGQSALFENVVVQKTEIVNGVLQSVSTPAVCGWVNSRNRMGGYTGAQRFVVKVGVPTFGDATDSEWSEAFMMCIIHSDDKAAGDRLTREGNRALDAYEKAVNELSKEQN